MVNPKQGEIYWTRFGYPGDSGPSGKRPAIVIQNDLLNRTNLRTTVVVLITSNLKLAAVPGNIRLKKGTANLPKSSVVVVTQVATIDKGRLLEKIGSLGQKKTIEIKTACQEVLS